MANDLLLELKDDKADFNPTDDIYVNVSWNLDFCPEKIDIRLYWQTCTGRNDIETSVVINHIIKTDETSGQQELSFELPYGPTTFEGKLFTINWFIEATAGKNKNFSSIKSIKLLS